jgi:hypothetical protein
MQPLPAIVALAGVALTLVPSRSQADELPAAPDDPPAHSSGPAPYLPTRPLPPGPDDGTLAPQALVAGLAAVAVPVGLLLFLEGTRVDTAPAVATIALASPLVVGGLVCAIGKSSSMYDGSCLAPLGPLGGAFLASAASVGLFALIQSGRDPNSDVDLSPVVLIAGWMVAEPILAVVGWRSYRKLRPVPPPAPGPATALALPTDPRRGLARLPGEQTLPLLSLSF